jgi:hypothetical protein
MSSDEMQRNDEKSIWSYVKCVKCVEVCEVCESVKVCESVNVWECESV